MFTGIIEEIGTVRTIQKGNERIELSVEANHILNDVHLGDSIAVNGVCLTVTSFQKNFFTVDVMPETYRSTNLKELNAGSRVNLERAMAAGGRFGGHFVSGHVDGIGEIIHKLLEKNAVYYEVKIPEEWMPYMMLKGSISIDGTSLTVFGTSENTVTVSLIPHTVSHTVLGAKGKGDTVNIECDMLAKYVGRMLNARMPEQKKSGITLGFLEEHGF